MELPLIALKFKQFGWKGNESRFILIGITALLLVTLKFLAVPAILIVYVLLSLADNLRKKRV
ncbi:hypothetical protein D3C87_1847210 [compost metagenome]